ncbi:hypothetical protein THAOC_00894, partial [Thalassiosira oceanica]
MVYTDMFEGSSCPIKSQPTGASGPWCQLCTPTNTPTTSPTSSPLLGPSVMPSTSTSLNPSTSPLLNEVVDTTYEITSNAELRQAMKEYLDRFTRDAAVSTYGPIESWGVSDISGWDVSKGKNFGSMFTYAYAFNQNLCPWGLLLDESRIVNHPPYSDYEVSVYSMFQDSGCPDTYWVSSFFSSGSWCQPCFRRRLDERGAAPAEEGAAVVNKVVPSTTRRLQSEITSNAELRQAMNEYLDPDTRDTAISTYG